MRGADEVGLPFALSKARKELSMTKFATVHGVVKKTATDFWETEAGAYVVAYNGAKLRATRWSFVLALRGSIVIGECDSMVTAEAGSNVIAQTGSSVLAKEGAVVYGKPGCSITLLSGAVLYMEGKPAVLINRGGTIIPVDKKGRPVKPASAVKK
jgi:hypothetical protein